jgi:hypothetical protein
VKINEWGLSLLPLTGIARCTRRTSLVVGLGSVAQDACLVVVRGACLWGHQRSLCARRACAYHAKQCSIPVAGDVGGGRAWGAELAGVVEGKAVALRDVLVA